MDVESLRKGEGKLKCGMWLHRLSQKLCHAERETGKLEACLADFGLSVVLPAPLEQKNSLLLSVVPLLCAAWLAHSCLCHPIA